MSYIGSSATPLPVNFSAVQSQGFNGTGSQTTFTLNRSVGSAASVEVLVNNVQQSPYDGSYNITGGTSLVFSEAPSAGTNNVYVVYRDQALGSLTDTGAVRKTGDTITGRTIVSVSTGKQLTIAQWGDASSADGGQTMVAGNAYFDKSSGAAKFSNSHGTIGAVGIRFNSPLWNEGSLFTAGVVGSTAENTFTPVDALIWDTAGRVRMPLQPAFSAVGSGVQSWSGGTATQVLQLAYKTGGIAAARSAGYNTSTYRFTAPVAGVYAFYHGYTMTSASTGPESYLYVNGTTVYHMGAIGYQYSGGYDTSVAVQLINLNANDYVDVRIQNNNNASFSIDLGRSYFDGYLIG